MANGRTVTVTVTVTVTDHIPTGFGTPHGGETERPISFANGIAGFITVFPQSSMFTKLHFVLDGTSMCNIGRRRVNVSRRRQYEEYSCDNRPICNGYVRLGREIPSARRALFDANDAVSAPTSHSTFSTPSSSLSFGRVVTRVSDVPRSAMLGAALEVSARIFSERSGVQEVDVQIDVRRH